MNEVTKISIFNDKHIRKIFFDDEWYFSVIDVCSVLVESSDSGAYWRKLKQRLIAEGSEVVTFCHGLKLMAPDGKKRETGLC
jgi:DNA-damage-inducible protein D